MRILVVGAGATGGYFGGRLLEAGRDVTFLVREKRAATLAVSGLVIKSAMGDTHIAKPPTLTAEQLRERNEAFDLVLLSCKAYDLDNAIESFAPAVGRQSMILPVLNGMRHLETLDARFGAERVLGGVCLIASTLDDAQAIVHLNDAHGLTYGERDGSMSARIAALDAQCQGANFTARSTDNIMITMWEKWVFLASLAATTCLMRAPLGDVESAPGGTGLILGLLDECRAVAKKEGYAPRAEFLTRSRTMLTTKGSSLTASMMRDVERGARTETDHVIGDLIARASPDHTPRGEVPLLRVAYTHLKAYEARRARRA